MRKKKCIAMLLAGGQGSRLGALTRRNAKPAVSFAGKYRIIDFSLSNCVNSGIDTVGVLIQYKPLVLNRYLGIGAAWDLDSSDGGVHVLPPYATEIGGSWYNGTADAIYHNLDFIDNYNPEYVLILSGDHLYTMDYSKMLDEHISNKADLTISVMEVPIEEASRFGIMTTNAAGRITKFQEKPSNPESNLASMGIYIFTWAVLRKALLEDHEDDSSEGDFGKNIIPKLLAEKKRLFAYRFAGYWQDVGTIDCYYETQMDLLKAKPEFDIFSDKTHIYSNIAMYPPHKIGSTGSVSQSLVCNGCIISGSVINSVIGSDVWIDEGTVIKDSIILPHARIGKNCRITRSIVNESVIIKDACKIGKAGAAVQVIDIDSEFSDGLNEEV